MFILTILKKIKEKRFKIFSRRCNSILKDQKFQQGRFKLTNTQLNKLKSDSKNKKGAILRINKKTFEDEELPHKSFVTTRQ